MKTIATFVLTAAIVVAQAKADKQPPKPKIEDCFKVDSMTVDKPELYEAEAHYTVVAHNSCPFEIEHVAVGVKFFDKEGYRIGVGLWLAELVSPNEKIRHQFRAVDINSGLPVDIKVALITTDLVKAEAFWPSGLSKPSISLVMENFSGTVRK